MPKLGEAYVTIRANLAPLKRGLALAKKAVRRSMAVMGKLMRKLSRIGRRIFYAFMAAVMGTVYAFVKFEQQLANVSTMLDDATMHYLPRYSVGLKNLAMAFGESTKTLSKGLYDILSASIAPAKAMNVLEVAVKAAKAGLTDTAIAADAITTVLNSYQMSAEDASKVSDILFATVKRGKTTFAELAGAIGKVTAIGSVAGISFEELSAAIATMTRAGLQVDIATTSMRGLINAFLKPTSEAKKMAKSFGFELSSNTLKTLGLVGVLKKLTGATGEQLASLIPNVRGMAGFAASLKAAEGQAKDLELMLHSTGLTQTAFDKMTKTLGYDLGRLRQTFTVLAVEIGKKLSPVIKTATTDMRVWLTENREQIKVWAGVVADKMGEAWEYIKALLRLISSGEWEVAFKKMTQTIINAFEFLWKYMRKYVVPKFVEIGRLMAQGIMQGLREEAPAIAKILAAVGAVGRSIAATKMPSSQPQFGLLGGGGDIAIAVLERIDRHIVESNRIG